MSFQIYVGGHADKGHDAAKLQAAAIAFADEVKKIAGDEANVTATYTDDTNNVNLFDLNVRAALEESNKPASKSTKPSEPKT